MVAGKVSLESLASQTISQKSNFNRVDSTLLSEHKNIFGWIFFFGKSGLVLPLLIIYTNKYPIVWTNVKSDIGARGEKE